MKNIHILPTDRPSKLWFNLKGKLVVDTVNCLYEDIQCQNIYITNSEEIKEGEYCITKTNEVIRFKKSYTQGFLYKKIILTTDQSLIQDDVQAINDEFLEWFVKNPSCEEVEVINFHTYFTQDVGNKGFYKIIIPSEKPITLGKIVPKERVIGLEEPKQECKGSFKDCFKPLNECVCDNMKQETLKDVAERLKGKELFKESNDRARKTLSEIKSLPIQERSYSEEEVIAFGEFIFKHSLLTHTKGVKSLFEQFKKK